MFVVWTCRHGVHSGFLLNVGLNGTKDVCVSVVLWSAWSVQLFYHHCMCARLCVCVCLYEGTLEKALVIRKELEVTFVYVRWNTVLLLQ